MPETSAPRPRRVAARALGVGIMSLAMAGVLTWAPAATTGWSQGAAESTLWQLMNGARVNNGRAPVQSHGTLVGLARWRSSDMLAKDYFSHTIAGCGCLVYAYYDSNGLSYGWAGENIGWNSGVSDAESPVRRCGPGHEPEGDHPDQLGGDGLCSGPHRPAPRLCGFHTPCCRASPRHREPAQAIALVP